MNPFPKPPSQLLPYLTDQKYGHKLVERFVGAGVREQERILEQVKELHAKPIIDDFEFPESPTDQSQELLMFKGHAMATKVTLSPRGFFIEESIKLPMLKAVDQESRFEFVIQNNEQQAYLVVCRVYPNYRGKGLFEVMVGALESLCFNDLGVAAIVGNAAPPRGEQEDDWRTEPVTYNVNYETTKLHDLWLRQRYAVQGKIAGELGDQGFALLNPKHLKDLPIETLQDLDTHHPKNKEDRFITLVKKRAA